jgi:hypothetical protein
MCALNSINTHALVLFCTMGNHMLGGSHWHVFAVARKISMPWWSEYSVHKASTNGLGNKRCDTLFEFKIDKKFHICFFMAICQQESASKIKVVEVFFCVGASFLSRKTISCK